MRFWCTYILLLILVLFVTPTFSQQKQLIKINDNECIAGNILVKLDRVAIQSRGQNHKEIRSQIVAKYQSKLVKRCLSGFELWQVPVDKTEAIWKSLNASPDIEFAEPDYIFYADKLSDDPYFDKLWAMENTGQTGGIIDADIDAPEAWDSTTGNREVVVGIIDSGIDYLHPDLEKNIWINMEEISGNGIDDDNNGYIDDIFGYDFCNDDNDPMDETGHGTHVAGIIGATANNQQGVAGVAWDVQLVSLKFMDSGSHGSSSAAISAIEYAMQQGVKIINCSWGGSAYSEALYEAIAAADSDGVIFITSAGNVHNDNDMVPHYPSSYDLNNIIAVAASDDQDNPASFSNWGIQSVDLSAPGTNILSTLPGNSYGYMNGTSMAVPHVTGTAVLVRSHFPDFTTHDVINQILSNVDAKESLIGTSKTAGRLNASRAVMGTSLIQLEINPVFLDFGVTLCGEVSSEQKIYIKNITSDIIYIQQIQAPDGFLISRDSQFSDNINQFYLDAGECDSIKIIFTPSKVQNYKQFLDIYSAQSGQTQAMQSTQLTGRGVKGTMIENGAVSGLWSYSESPYYIKCDIFVENGKLLEIEPGVHIEFLGYYSFTIGENSSFQAIGTESDSILFYPYDIQKGWNGLRFINSGSDDLLRYCSIQYSKKISDSPLNEAQKGGGIYCSGSDPVIIYSLIAKNVAQSGGGIYLSGSDPIIKNVSLLENVSLTDGGGGIYCDTSNPHLQDILIAKNKSLNWFIDGNNGGGIYCRSSSPELINVTVADNVANKGGGIYISHKSSNPIIVNSIFWDNIPDQITFSNEPKIKSVAIAYSDIEDGQASIETGATGKLYWLGGNIEEVPLFLNPERSEYRLHPESPCIDAAVQDTLLIYNNGENTIVVPTLLFNGMAPDMGAFESFNVVPVELTTFAISVSDYQVEIKWTTLTEINNLGFEIQKSSDKKTFSKIGFIKGNGTTLTPNDYSFFDKEQKFGIYYYRLKQIDTDGSFNYSPIVEAIICSPKTFTISQNYPNPFNSSTKIHLQVPVTTKIELSVFNCLGQKILTLIEEEKQVGSYELLWDGKDYMGRDVTSGIYFFKMKSASFSCTKKMVIIR